MARTRRAAALAATTLTVTLAAAMVTAGAAGGTAAADPDPAGSADPVSSAITLFKGGHKESLNGITYHSFRIPAIVRTNAGTLLAFAEGRAESNKDWGNINLVYKRGTENGTRWTGLKEVVGSGLGTWGNPTPVVDRDTGTIFVFLSWNPEGYSQGGGYDPDTGTTTTKITEWGQRRVFAVRSTDDGETFTGLGGEAKPTDLTESLLPKTKADGRTEWAWDAVGPGAGLQAADHRLIIPAQHRNLYSTDHGATWHVEKLAEDTSEATITQLADGSLYRNDRPTSESWRRTPRRWVSWQRPGGDSYSPFEPDEALPDVPTQASVLQYNNDAPARTIFLNPADTVHRAGTMRVRISYDGARTWPVDRPLKDAPPPAEAGTEGGYSSMAKTSDYRVGALVESNLDTGHSGTSYRSIVFRKFNLSWILH